MGCSHVGLGMRPDSFADTAEGWSGFISDVNRICRQVADAGMTFGYHNHAFEFRKIDGVRAIDRLAGECPGLDFILDVFWVQAAGGNPSEWLEKLAGRVRLVHLKDYAAPKRFAEVGSGNLDWNDIIPRCRRLGIPRAVVEQDGDFASGDPFDSLAASRKFLVERGFWG